MIKLIFTAERQVDKNKAIEDHLNDLVATLEGEVGFLVTHMELEEVLNPEMIEVLKVEKANKAKLIVLLEWFKVKDNCWNILMDYLKINHPLLATQLEISAGIRVSQSHC